MDAEEIGSSLTSGELLLEGCFLNTVLTACWGLPGNALLTWLRIMLMRINSFILPLCFAGLHTSLPGLIDTNTRR